MEIKKGLKSISDDYISPIEVFASDMMIEVERKQEGEILKAVQNVGVNVDKEELIKALAYDRDQYNKGFRDGIARRMEELFGIDDYERIIPESIQVKDTGYYNLQHKYMAIFLAEAKR